MKAWKEKRKILAAHVILLVCLAAIAAAFLIYFFRIRNESDLPVSNSKRYDVETEKLPMNEEAAMRDGMFHSSEKVVIPQQFGALADGVHDDAPALQKALESGNPVVLVSDLYLFSSISIWDHDVSLNGNGHTLYCDGSGMEICAALNQDPDSDAAVVSEIEPYYNSYHRGYISYQGSSPLAETLGECTVDYFHEYHADLSNVRFMMKNCDGMCALELRRMCKSVVNHVSAICEDGSDGEVGILISNCYQIRVEDCYAQNWTAENTCDRGYGIEAFGNDILISGCSAYGNKHDICICSGRDIISNHVTVKDCKVGCVYDAQAVLEDGSKKYQARFDIHAAGEEVAVDGLQIVVEDAQEDTVLAALRSPEAQISRLQVDADGGYMVFGELANSFCFTDLQMPNSSILGGYSKQETIKRLQVTDGRIKGLEGMLPNTTIYLENVAVEDEIDQTYHVIQRNIDG